MRWFYSLLWWVSLPLVLMRLWWRGRKEPGYRQHIAERLGFYDEPPPSHEGRLVWLHAVSVGETRAAEPLVRELLDVFPDCGLLLTHMTPTGRAAGRELYGKYGERFRQVYLPYDTGWMVRRFLRHFAPRLCILMETEVWPNLIAQCNAQQVPVALVNARLSERSLARAGRFGGLLQQAAQGIAFIAAQTEADAERLRKAGAASVEVTGNIKFDVCPTPAMLDAGAAMHTRFGSRRVLLCASTREGEETLILDALAQAPLGEALLVLVPRHPQRFDDVAREIEARGLAYRRRSSLGYEVPPEVQVVLGDSMGEMFAYYVAADLAFIGGSLLPLGGQNLIEACAVGTPVLIGEHTFNFAAVSNDAVAEGAAIRVQDATAMLQQAAALLADDDTRRAMGMRAREYALQHRGATARTVWLLAPLLG
jgi:3-deoxy-D-manno-octulosonic-acid transferase